MDNIRNYFKNNFPKSKVLDSSINRGRNGIQSANISILFEDETGDVVVSAQYFSDESHLIGAEVSKRVKKSVQKATQDAQRLAGEVIDIK